MAPDPVFRIPTCLCGEEAPSTSDLRPSLEQIPSLAPSATDLGPSETASEAEPTEEQDHHAATPPGTSPVASRRAAGGESPRAQRASKSTAGRPPVDASRATELERCTSQLATWRELRDYHIVQAVAVEGATLRAVARLVDMTPAGVADVVRRRGAAYGATTGASAPSTSDLRPSIVQDGGS